MRKELLRSGVWTAGLTVLFLLDIWKNNSFIEMVISI